MFSVIIPLYNKEEEITNTLNSVLSQTYKYFEIIIVNDGSTDNSLKVLNSFDDDRIKIINQKNGGVSLARNRGIKEANYEWIAFLDADDLWELNKLQRIAGVIKNNKKVPWIITGYKIIKNNKEYDRTYKVNGFLKDALEDLDKGLSIQTSSVVVKRSYFINDEKLFFKVGINNSEDREVWYRLIFRYPSPYYIKEALSYYLKDTVSESLTNIGTGSTHFLELKDRLNDDISNLTDSRRTIIIKFLNKFNELALWSYWLNGNLTIEHSKYLNKRSIQLQNIAQNFPYKIKKMIVKLIVFVQ